MKRVLTIAGSDSGGGAGIQADIKTITLLGGYAMSVVTALTAQNTKEVRAIHALPPAFIEQQLDTVLSDIGADAAKTGMLFNAPAIETVANRLSAYGMKKIVVDPVMVAKGGDTLLVEEARETLAKCLIPMAMLVTPNLPEAGVLSNKSISTEKDIHEAARIIKAMGAKYVLIKGPTPTARGVLILQPLPRSWPWTLKSKRPWSGRRISSILPSALPFRWARGMVPPMFMPHLPGTRQDIESWRRCRTAW
jgi:hydroxymethylpyrimidine kinase/phosphomethylpyrimidine kinase